MENGVVKEGDILNQGSAVINKEPFLYLGSNDLCYCCQCEKHIRAPLAFRNLDIFRPQNCRYLQLIKIIWSPAVNFPNRGLF